MSILAFRLKNFMAFEDTGWIELRPISLLFGKNSSGKSAIIRALRLLKQSLLHGSSDYPLAFYTEGGLDLKDYRTTVHQHDMKKVMSFYFKAEFKEAAFEQLLDVIKKDQILQNEPALVKDKISKELEVQLSYGIDSDNSDKVKLVGLNIEFPWKILDDKGKRIAFSAEKEMEIEEKEENQLLEKWTWSEKWIFYSDFLHGHETETKNQMWLNASLDFVSAFMPELSSTVRVSEAKERTSEADFLIIRDLLAEFRYTLSDFLKKIEWIGPIRPEPERAFYIDRMRFRSWENLGLSAYAKLLRNRFDRAVGDKLNYWLKELQLGITIRFPSSGGELETLATVQVQECQEGEFENLIDMGYGASQILPILAVGLLTPKDTLIMIEQPELHLHPKAQAILGDFFVDFVDRGVLLFLETHSEHILLRMRNRLVQSSLSLAQSKLRSEEITSHSSFRINEKTVNEIRKNSKKILSREFKKISKRLRNYIGTDYVPEPMFKVQMQEIFESDFNNQLFDFIKKYSDQHVLFFPEDWSTYFTDRKGSLSNIYRLEINEFGEFSADQPSEFQEFFADDAIEVMEITHNALMTEAIKGQDNR